MGSYKSQQEKDSLENAFTTAKSDLEGLQEEMESWFDNLPENLQSSERGERIQEANDALVNAMDQLPDDLDELPEGVRNLEITYHISVNKRKGRGESRDVRCGNACAMLEAVADALDDQAKGEDFNEELQSMIEEAAESIRTGKDEAESVEFPGMFG